MIVVLAIEVTIRRFDLALFHSFSFAMMALFAGPCVAIQHEDFVGNVALEGMTSNEFKERV